MIKKHTKKYGQFSLVKIRFRLFIEDKLKYIMRIKHKPRMISIPILIKIWIWAKVESSIHSQEYEETPKNYGINAKEDSFNMSSYAKLNL